MDQQIEKTLQHSNSFEILPALTPEEEAKMQKQYRERLEHFYNKNKKYEIDYWYPSLKQYTYSSFCFPLTIMQAYLLHALYYQNEITSDLLSVRNSMVQKINKLLQEHSNQYNKGKYFMKLSTRSPKDYCWDYRDQQQFKKAVESLKRFLENQNINNQSSVEKLNNALYKFFLVNSHQRLMIQTGNDFFKIFSKSQRIITDLNDFSYLKGRVFEKIKDNTLQESEKNKELTNVWVRDWVDCNWEQEFRTFYYAYKLTGISQYDQRCYFPGLASRKEEIAKKCLELFEKARPRLQDIQLDRGVMDFMIKPDEIKIVEINIFDRDARASLFNWNEDEKILMNGPLEVRVLEKQIQISKAHLGSIMGMIEKKSIDVITTALDQIGLLNIWK